MAQKKRTARPAPRPSGSGGPRRLGNQTPSTRPVSAGAARRAARQKRRSSPQIGWIAVGVVAVVIVALVVFRLTENSSPSTAGQSSGRNPVLASSAIVEPVTNVSTTVFNQVGTDKLSAAFELTKTKKPVEYNGKVQFVYYGAEYCPYCALMRYSIIAALSRFGTFSGLKETSSSSSDGNIPTYSFLGAKYSSPYVSFRPYEGEDRNRDTLQVPPKDVQSVIETYDFPPYTTQANEGGIPFLSIGNVYIAGGDSQQMSALFENGTLVNGGPGRQIIADSLQSPFSATGQAVGGAIFDAQANYIAAAICLTNGGKPASVCASSGVKAAEAVLSAEKPTT